MVVFSPLNIELSVALSVVPPRHIEVIFPLTCARRVVS